MLEIVDLVAEPFDVELTEPFGIATGAQARAANALVRLTLADGSVGLGEAAPFPAVNGETRAMALEAARRAASSVVGKDARRWRRLARELAEAIGEVPSARCAIESALLDALCRSRGLSLWSFFGGAEKALVTDITIPTGDAQHARASAERALRAGFETLKLKVGGADPSLDLARIQAIRVAAPRAKLVLDANAALSATAAIELVRAIGDGVVLFEQPTPTDDLESMARVRRETGVPVAADESAKSAAGVARLASAKACDVVNLKITKSGVAETLDMIAVARAHGLGLMIGGMVETELAMTVSACLAAGVGGFAFVDLDTPLFLAETPTRGGVERSGSVIRVSGIEAGHGVSLAYPSANSGHS